MKRLAIKELNNPISITYDNATYYGEYGMFNVVFVRDNMQITDMYPMERIEKITQVIGQDKEPEQKQENKLE